MNKIVTLAASAAMVLASAGVTLAGGPTATATEVEPVADNRPAPPPLLFGSLGAGGAVVAVLAVAAIAVAASSGGDSSGGDSGGSTGGTGQNGD